MNWSDYRCTFCGGDAHMGIMSLVARCEKCGARNTEMDSKSQPTAWVMLPKQESD